MQLSDNSRVFAVVVAFQPNAVVLRALLETLLAQTTGVLVVDNTAEDDRRVESLYAEFPQKALQLIRLGSNFGIAHALNVGIDVALSAGATHVLLSDQDSLPAPDMVKGLLRALAELTELGHNMGGVGPTYTDIHTQKTHPFKAIIPGKFFPGEVVADKQRPLVEALSLITSGTLIPAIALETVGLMRADFFIDRVDTEWCLRARSHGYKIFGTIYATMYQRMGEHSLTVWYGTWRQVSAYSPIRIYYQIRNSLYMWRLNYVSLRLKIRSTWYAMGVAYSNILFGNQKTFALRMAWRGFRDGLIGRMGPYRDPE